MIAWPALASALALLTPSRSWAEEERRELHPLQHTSAQALVLETLGAVSVFGGYSLATGSTPRGCSWCAPNGFDTWVRDQLLIEHSRGPAVVSHVLTYGVVPVGAGLGVIVPALLGEQKSFIWQDTWIIANGAILTLGISQGTKKLAARQRPAFHYGRQAETEYSASPGQANLSFFSGDTASAFSVAASATTLAYLRGYGTAPWLAVGGGVLASGVGILRIAADMHWATDVMAGAAVGTAVGVGLPLLLHQRENSDRASQISVAPLLGGGLYGALVSSAW